MLALLNFVGWCRIKKEWAWVFEAAIDLNDGVELIKKLSLIVFFS